MSEKDREARSGEPEVELNLDALDDENADSPDSADSADSSTGSESAPVGAAARRSARQVRSGSTAKKGVETAARNRPEQRGNIFARIWRFILEVVAELRKVIWPTRKQMVTYTIVVLVFVSFMVALVWGLDWVFAKGVLAVFG